MGDVSGRLLSGIFDTCVINRGKGFDKTSADAIELPEGQSAFVELTVTHLLFGNCIDQPLDA